MKYFILSLFILTYLLIIIFPKRKVYFTGGAAIIMGAVLLIFGKSDFIYLLESIDYNVILMLIGIMITVYFFTDSNMPSLLAEKLISKLPNSLIAIVLISALAGIVSAFLDNVATVLMLAPIGIAICKKINISPVPVIISIAVSSNLQGAATLVGDTTSIMLASENFADMSFFDFFFLDGKFSIFWAVEIGAVLTIPIIIFLFRKQNKKLSFSADAVKVKSIFPTVMLLLNLGLLIGVSFISNKWSLTNGIICMSIGVICLIFCSVKNKDNPIKTVTGAVDFETVLFLAFLFIIIGCVEKVGIIDDIGNKFASLGTENLFLLYTLITFGSVILSAFIDNIPYVATMLPVVASISSGLNLPFNATHLLYFGLLCGSTLGGNLTPFGASANVVGIGILRKEGYEVKTKDFIKIGLPFTLVAVLGGFGFCYLVWGI